MKKLVVLVGTLIVLLLAGWAGATWWFGTQVQRQYQELLNQVSQRGLVTLSEESYHRGFWGATARTRVQLPLPRGSKGHGGRPLTFTLEQQIQYGPFPLGTPGWRPVRAFIHSRVILGPATLRRVQRFFPACPAELPLIGTTVVYLRGNGETDLEIPPLHRKLGKKDPQTVDWQGLDARSIFSPDLKHVRGVWQAPGLSLAGRQGTLQMAGLWADFDLDMPRGSQGLMLGNMAYGLDALSFSAAAAGPGKAAAGFVLKGVKIQGASLASKGLVNSSFRAEFARLLLHGRENGPGIFDMQIRNLDAAALEKLQRLSRRVGAGGRAAGKPGAQALASYTRVLAKLASHSPVLEIREFRFRGADGQLNGTARIAIDGSRAAALHSLLQLPAALTARATLSISEHLLRGLMTALIRQQIVAARRARHLSPLPKARLDGYAVDEARRELQNLVAQKVLVPDGDLLRLKASYTHGKAVLNGRTLSAPAGGGEG